MMLLLQWAVTVEVGSSESRSMTSEVMVSVGLVAVDSVEPQSVTAGTNDALVTVEVGGIGSSEHSGLRSKSSVSGRVTRKPG